DLGELEAAAKSYGKALALAPDYAQAYSNLGHVQREQGKLDEAIGSYRQAIALQPDLRAAHHGLSAVLRARGDLAGAAAGLRHAIDASDPHAHNDLASALCETGDLTGAEAHCRIALSLDPGFAVAHSNLGGVLRRQKRFTEAIESCRRAIQLDPQLAAAYGNLGDAYFGSEDFPAAALSYRHAIDLNFANADVHHNLAVVLFRQDQVDEALTSCREALSFKEATAQMHATFGDILSAKWKIGEALDSYRRAIELDPGLRFAHMGLMFNQASWSRCEPAQLLADSCRFGRSMALEAKPRVHEPVAAVARPLRVGFVSGDLRSHPVAVFIETLMRELDPQRVQIVAYSAQPSGDETTARLKPYFTAWREIGELSDEEAANLIERDGIDVLLDLSGHTKFNRLPLFVWKPAPVQATWLGYFATTGIAEINYILGDRHVLPVEEEWHFTEKPWRLPDSYLCFTPPPETVDVSPLPADTQRAITFGCLNNANKLNDGVVALWARVLLAIPGSRLVLKSAQFGQASFCENMTGRFGMYGITADRIVLLGQTYREQHLQTYHLMDIALDPFPYPGGTTSAESLWMGVPVLTRKGDRFLSHVGETIAHAVGMPEWIARDDDEYVAKAVAFARDMDALRVLRGTLRERLLASPLCDARRFARHFEDAMAGMHASVVKPASRTG
ncbi:tetratricopeptide repeat protein, partial [Paraburkholderia phymatum]